MQTKIQLVHENLRQTEVMIKIINMEI